jgi:hypothetical protein
MLVICPMHRNGTAKSIDRQSQEKAFVGTPPMVRRDERKWNGTGDVLLRGDMKKSGIG